MEVVRRFPFGFVRGSVRRLSTVGLGRGVRDDEVRYIGWAGAGHALLENPTTNKGSAFTPQERHELGLAGLLPPKVETLNEQVERAYFALQGKETDLERHIYLRQLQDINETLFYALFKKHIEEFLPILYTPTVGLACLKFSQIFRRPRGLFLSYEQRDMMDSIFYDLVHGRGWTGAPMSSSEGEVTGKNGQEVSVIVVTDGGRILGLGDLGANGMGIPIGKTALYTGLGGIPGRETLPIMLDVGTDNRDILADPHYIGWRHHRLSGKDYFDFVDQFVECVKKYFPNAVLQWEDFNINAAHPLLVKYKDTMCTFNDDIQCTATVAAGTLMAACRQQGRRVKDMKVVFVGSGTAGCGVASMIKQAMINDGATAEQASGQIFMVDRPGLLHDGINELRDFQRPLLQKKDALAGWKGFDGISYSLLDVIKNAKPDVLVGISGVPGLFSEPVIRAMTKMCAPHRPIVFPLSNPTSRVEGEPKDIIEWSDGLAVVATGTAFPSTEIAVQKNKYEKTIITRVHTQCNNSYCFPGIGLALKTVQASRVTDNMFMAAATALAQVSAERCTDPLGPLLPPLAEMESTGKAIALAVAVQCIKDGKARRFQDKSPEELRAIIQDIYWQPEYKTYKLSDNLWVDTKNQSLQ